MPTALGVSMPDLLREPLWQKLDDLTHLMRPDAALGKVAGLGLPRTRSTWLTGALLPAWLVSDGSGEGAGVCRPHTAQNGARTHITVKHSALKRG
jgi:hypothetical protein